MEKSLIVMIAFVAGILPGCGQKATPQQNQQNQGGLSGDLVLFHAGSLAVPLREVSALFKQENPGVTVKARRRGVATCPQDLRLGPGL